MDAENNLDLGELKTLEWIHESVSALCCAATYVVAEDGTWERFKDWLTGVVTMDPGELEILRVNATRQDMAAALVKADRLLMMIEGMQTLGDPGLCPPWMNEEQ